VGDGMSDVQQVQVLNSWIHDWDNEGSGIAVRRAADVEVAGNTLTDSGAGETGEAAIAASGFQQKIHHNTIRGGFNRGVSLFRGFENQVYANQIAETAATMAQGISADSEFALLVSDNHVFGAQYGIMAEVSPYAVIQGNQIVRNREKGVYVWGRNGVDQLLVENGEDTWSCAANVTCSTTAGQVGTNAARLTIASGFSTGVVAHEDLASPVDSSGHVYLRMWVRSDTELLSGVLSARLSATGGLGSNTVTAALPKLHANTWQKVYLPMRAYWGTLTAINSVGIVANSDPGAAIIDVDDVQVETIAWKNSVSGNLIAESDCRACIDVDQAVYDTDISQNQMFDVGRFTLGTSGATGIFLRSVGGPTTNIRVVQNLIRSEYSGAGEGNQIGIDNRGTDNYIAFNRVVGFPSGQAVDSSTATGAVAMGNLTTDADDDLNLSAGSVINWGTDTNLRRIGTNLLGTDDDFEALTAGERVRMGAQGPGGQAGLRFGPSLDTNLYRSAAGMLKTDDGLAFANAATFGNSDATPSVAGGNFFKTGNSGATTITALDDGAQGQQLLIVCGDTNTTFSDAGTLRLAGGLTCTADDTLTLIFDGTNWLEISRSVN
jgi:hypothetical protein